MKRNTLANILSAGILGIAIFASCKRGDCDDPVPSLSYSDFEVAQDTGTLVYNFRDCDGDIGLESTDTIPPFQVGGEFHYNLKTDLLVWDDTEWRIANADDDIGEQGFNERIPLINEETQEELLEGKIKYRMPINWLRILTTHDSVRFRTTLVDRALNESSAVTTPTIFFTR